MIRGDKLTELQETGFCVLRANFPAALIEACREAFWPTLLDYLNTHREAPNRGPHRHYLPMPFNLRCFIPEFFFDPGVLGVIHRAMDTRVVADQWGCDVPVQGSQYQTPHVDYERPLFAEAPDLILPTYMLVVSFGLVPITSNEGPIQIAPGTHRMRRQDALQEVQSADIELISVPLEVGDVLIRHPWAIHRGTPNRTDTPRALLTIRYVRRWYVDNSRDVNAIPRAMWDKLTPVQQSALRFPVACG